MGELFEIDDASQNLVIDSLSVNLDEFENQEEVELYKFLLSEESFLSDDLTKLTDDELLDLSKDFEVDFQKEGLKIKANEIYQMLLLQKEGANKEDLALRWVKIVRKSSFKTSVYAVMKGFARATNKFRRLVRRVKGAIGPIDGSQSNIKNNTQLADLMKKQTARNAKRSVKIYKMIFQAISKILSAIGIPIGAPLVAIIFFAFMLLFAIATFFNSGTQLTGKPLQVYNFLHAKGVPDMQIAGILGNFAVETGSKELKTDAIENEGESIEHTTGGIGICQWTGSRRSQYLSYIEFLNKNPTNHTGWDKIENQLEFFWFEYDEEADKTFAINQWTLGCSTSVFYTKTTVDDSTVYFCNGFERPNSEYALMERRKEYAREYYEKIMNNPYDSSSLINWLVAFSEDNAHGYVFGASHGSELESDVDCSSFVYWGLVCSGDIDTVGCFTTLSMGKILKEQGFEEFPYTNMDDLIAGDILVNKEHTEVFIGDGKLVGAHTDSLPLPLQVSVIDYYENNWEYVYRKMK